MKLDKGTVQSLVLLREELRFLNEQAGFLGGTDNVISNADWNGTAAILRPRIILHTEGLSGNSDRGLRQVGWFTVVSIPKSFRLTMAALDDLIGQQEGDNSAVDALTTLAQYAAPLPDHQRNQVTKALGTVRKVLRVRS